MCAAQNADQIIGLLFLISFHVEDIRFRAALALEVEREHSANPERLPPPK